MHNTKGIAHLDLKAENILIANHLSKPIIKVADFGIATDQNIQSLNTMNGTISHMPPEVLEFKNQDGKKRDIFALGIILFEIVVGTSPLNFACKNSDQKYKHLAKGDL